MFHRRVALIARMTLPVLALLVCSVLAEDATPALDPAAWGSDHVGKSVPEFVSGDQCLFCHRKDIGPAWPQNRHGLTVRVASRNSDAERSLNEDDELREYANAVEYLLGTGNHQRFLKHGNEYGHLDLLSVKWSQSRNSKSGILTDKKSPNWNPTRFGEACAGCHATAVDVSTEQFTATSLDCFVCHGDPPDSHTENASMVHLSPARETPAREVMSICGQCHLRGGRSKSSGNPYANNFVAGDNLFRDFQVNLSEQSIRQRGPADGHVFANVREVVLLGVEKMTCLTCHSVHQQSTEQHKTLNDTNLCWQCHEKDDPKSLIKSVDHHSPTCEY